MIFSWNFFLVEKKFNLLTSGAISFEIVDDDWTELRTNIQKINPFP